MLQVGRYLFKRADAGNEFEQIHRLNYRTFVEEIPQHAASRRGRLIDKFHAKNTYFVALLEGRVVGILSVHDQPPFSVADRLPDPSILDAPGRRPLEVRLLAVEPEHRTGPVLAGLLFSVLQHARDRYHDVYISGVAKRVAMYERLGGLRPDAGKFSARRKGGKTRSAVEFSPRAIDRRRGAPARERRRVCKRSRERRPNAIRRSARSGRAVSSAAGLSAAGSGGGFAGRPRRFCKSAP